MAADSTANTIKIDPLEERLRQQKREKLIRRAIPLLLTIPYLLGLIWTALHPLVSIITGELKCRGIYIDENGLDVHRHQVESYPLRRTVLSSSRGDIIDTGLCDAIYSGRLPISHTSVECIRHAATDYITFDVARIMPSMGPMIDLAEAVVIVVGEQQSQCSARNHDNNKQEQKKGFYDSSDLNASMLHMIKKLGNRNDAPWLAKIVYIVSPTTVNVRKGDNVTDTSSCRQTNLTTFVDKFVTSYFGDGDPASSKEYVNPLPHEYSFPIMRSLLVISDVVEQEPKQRNTEVRILPQGTGGALPNLDLVFATFYAFQTYPAGGRFDKSQSVYYGNSVFRAHPFGNELENRVKDIFIRLEGIFELEMSSSASLRKYASDLAGWIGFVAGLVIGPVQPHSFALNKGIDALTIEIHIPTTKSSLETFNPDSAIHPHYADLSRCVEHLLRSISNLHERLHHSVAQYTMPSPSKFVSHGEYIYPAILVSLPMVVRAVSLALSDITSFQFSFVWIIVGTVLCASCVNACTDFATGRSFIGVLMMLVAWVVHRNIPRPSNEEKKVGGFDATSECRKSLRFVTCLAGIYLHVPLLLANYSLGFPSAVLWTPLLAIIVLPDQLYSALSKSAVLKILVTIAKILLLVAISPSTMLPSNISPRYVLIVHTPLQLLLTALWFCS